MFFLHPGTHLRQMPVGVRAMSGVSSVPADIQTFTSAGAATWTKPSGSPKWVQVICVGAALP